MKEIAGEKGAFALALADGETVEAENVVLAIGTQGNPNLVRCPGRGEPAASSNISSTIPASISTSISP